MIDACNPACGLREDRTLTRCRPYAYAGGVRRVIHYLNLAINVKRNFSQMCAVLVLSSNSDSWVEPGYQICAQFCDPSVVAARAVTALDAYGDVS